MNKKEVMKKIVAKSEFTDEDVMELDKKVKAGLLKRFTNQTS